MSLSRAQQHWIIFAVLYVVAVVVTFFCLLDADITMALAHQQWEIHEEVALDLTLRVWGVVLIVFLVVHFCFRLYATLRRKA